MWGYLEEQVESAINGTAKIIPAGVQKWLADVGLDGVLDATRLATEAYTGPWFAAEMRGMADAAGVDFKRMMRIHMIGELTKGACSMFGAWGAATGGGTLQLRALDWDVDGLWGGVAFFMRQARSRSSHRSRCTTPPTRQTAARF